MPIYGGTTPERPWTISRQTLLPDLPSTIDALVQWAELFDHAVSDSISNMSRLLQSHIEVSGVADVGAAATTATITLEQPTADATYGVLLTPSWNAAVWYTGRATTGFTINTSAAPGGGGGTVTWAVVR